MKLKGKLRLSFLVIGLIPLALTGVLWYRLARERWLNNLHAQLEAFAALKEQQIVNLLRQNAERLSLITSRTQLCESLAAFLSDPDEPQRARMIRIIQDAARSSARIRAISVLNDEGTVVASTRSEDLGLGLADEGFFRAGRERDIANMLVLDADHHLQFYLAGPLRLNKQRLGVLVIEAAADDLLRLLRDHRGLGETGETLLVERDQHGHALVLTPLPHDPHTAVRRVVSQTETNSPVVLSLQQPETGLQETMDQRGVPVLAATRYLPQPRWGIVVKIDRAEALAPIMALRNVCLLALFATLLVIIFLSLLVARSITEPLLRLTETAARISAGDFNRRAAVASHDEIGVLAQSFNEMAESLTTANKSLDAKVRERTAALERSNKDLELFACVASHDLQEPLRAVSGCVQILEQQYRGQLDAHGQELMRRTVEGAQRMQRLIYDLLQYSRMDASPEAFTAVDCETIFGTAFENLSVAIGESGAIITHDRLPGVQGEPTQLMQLFQNLLGNAIKYRDKERPPSVHVGVQRQGAAWRFSVRDNGIGIERRFYHQIFGVFQRLHPGQEYEGSGLGLALCKRIVEHHGGAIGVDAEVGQGSTFWFTLPAGPDDGGGSNQ